MSNIQKNSRTAVNLAAFNSKNYPSVIGEKDLIIPQERQYVLRMLIRRYYSGWKIPENLKWCCPLIEMADQYQKEIGVSHPFCYLTVRFGIVDSITDDEWHVDGFSTRITHLPEQNYIWSDNNPTEYVVKEVDFPSDFDPLVYNVHKYIQQKVMNEQVFTCQPKYVYCLDPYVIHRRPPLLKIQRTFVRVSFTPIEILDKNNTFNPDLPTEYDRDGVEIRNQLIEYTSQSVK